MALETHISFADVVGVFVDVSGQAEVTNLDHIVLGEQDVSGRQVSVDTLRSKEGSLLPDSDEVNTQKWFRTYLARGQKLHAFGHLEAVADEILHCQVVVIGTVCDHRKSFCCCILTLSELQLRAVFPLQPPSCMSMLLPDKSRVQTAVPVQMSSWAAVPRPRSPSSTCSSVVGHLWLFRRFLCGPERSGSPQNSQGFNAKSST